MDVLELEEIYKIFGSEHGIITLKNINFALEKEEFVAVMGPSGSGKTTLLNIAASIMKPSSGRVIFDGEDIGQLKDDELAIMRREKIGFVFQDFRLIDNLNVKENIILPLVLNGVKDKEINKKFSRLVEVLGLQEEINKNNIYELSGGQKQRIAIARAIIHEPMMLFADEPTGKLDFNLSNNIMRLLQNINKNLNISILMVTHNSLAASFSSRALFLKDGEIYNEIYKGNEERSFYKSILDVVAFLGGKSYDF